MVRYSRTEMDARKVGIGTLCLAASGAMLTRAGVPGGSLLIGLSGLGAVGPVASELRQRTETGRWPV